jgi:hypothetical protein
VIEEIAHFDDIAGKLQRGDGATMSKPARRDFEIPGGAVCMPLLRESRMTPATPFAMSGFPYLFGALANAIDLPDLHDPHLRYFSSGLSWGT